jgi:hypothetical protein
MLTVYPHILLNCSDTQALRDKERNVDKTIETFADDDLKATAIAAPGEELIKMTGVRHCLYFWCKCVA